MALGLGTAAGALSYLAGPWLAAAWGWVGGFAAALGLRARTGLRRLLPLSPERH